MSTTERVLHIGSRRIGAGEPCYVIAEVGINHNGDLAIAKQLVDAAVTAGADAVKFQKRRLRETYREEIIDQPRHGEQGLQYIVPMLIEFELSDDEFRELFEYCGSQEITALCTPWDRSSVDFLETCELAAYKIGSPDLTNFPLIEYVARTDKPMLLSTGMSTEEEVRRTLVFLEQCEADYALFHCVSTYPAAPEEINLRFMERLREWSGRPVGYSGHDNGIAISLAAVAMGARMIERHLTLDRNMRGPDHKASLEPHQFADQVRLLREVEVSLGVPHRWITRGETLNRRVLAKSLVAATDIPARTTITPEMLTSKSPGLGLSPQFVDKLVGRRLPRAIARDEMFLHSDVEDAVAGREAAAIDVGAPWGIVARFLDFAALEKAFVPLGMRFVEFHVSDRDLDAGASAYDGGHRPFGFVVHAPEYAHDTLIDLCSADEAQRELSIQRIQKTICLARDLAPQFEWDEKLFPRGPKIVMHVGGMSPKPGRYDLHAATDRLLSALQKLDTSGVDLLLENLPPYPWYFGGRWFGYVICDSENTVLLCKESGLGLCFDTSHAALECAKSGEDLLEFGKAVSPFVRHLHLSDGAGTSGEGLQIGDGSVNFVALLPVLLETQPTVIPEIWMGHHENGLAFRAALERLTEIHWASVVLGRPAERRRRPDLRALTVMDDATIFTALRVIDTNKMGIAFVLDGDRRVVGVVTDGDIRHAFVRGINLHDEVGQAMTRKFVSGQAGMSAAELRGRLPGRTQVMPVVDADGRLVDFASLETNEGERPKQ
jgi:sialic acid synthase SpsE/sugar phosphate isomerase/epimerase/CBS domain-containing protein